MEKLTESLGIILDKSLNEIYILDQITLQFLYANNGALLNLGYTKDELYRLTAADIKPLLSAEQLREKLTNTQHQTESSSVVFETIHQRKNKTTYPVEVHCFPITYNKTNAYVAFVLDITRREQSHERLELVLQGSSLGYWDWNYQTDKHTVNDRWLEMLGMERSDIQEHKHDWCNNVHPDDCEALEEKIEQSIKSKQPYTAEFRMRHTDGSWVWIQGSGSVVAYDVETKEPLRLCGTHQDITERKEAELQTKYIKRVLKTLIKTTQSINSASTEASILEDTCKTLIETGGYHLAWIGYVEHDDLKTVRPVAQYGFDGGYVNAAQITWADSVRGQGPIGTAIRTKTSIVTQNVKTDPTFEPWREAAIKHGHNACLALPLIVGTEVLGSLNIYAKKFYAFDDDVLTFLKDLASTVAFGIKNQRLELENKTNLSNLESSLVQTIKAMSLAIEKRDPYTSGHMDRVAQLAVAIAEKLELDPDVIVGTHLSATIHDLGKIYAPAEILNRPGKLSDPEFEIIKSHSQVGYDIIKGIDFPWPIAQIVLQHHERRDGSGYPNGLKGDDILFEAQILAVADTVEAMNSHRPYRPALSLELALDTIKKGKGHHYNPEIVDACVKLFSEDGFEFDTSF